MTVFIEAPDLKFILDGGDYATTRGIPPAVGTEVHIEHPLHGGGDFRVTRVKATYRSTNSHVDVAAAQRGDVFTVVAGPVFVHVERITDQ